MRRCVDRDEKNQTSFVRCVLWGKSAEVLSKYCQKSSLIGGQGELVTRQYDDQQGVTNYVTEVWLDSFDFLESKEARLHREKPTSLKEETSESKTSTEASKTALRTFGSTTYSPIDGLTAYGAETESMFDE